MPLSNLLKSAADTCPLCNQKAGILSREHPDCRRTFQAGWSEMVHGSGVLQDYHPHDDCKVREGSL